MRFVGRSNVDDRVRLITLEKKVQCQASHILMPVNNYNRRQRLVHINTALVVVLYFLMKECNTNDSINANTILRVI